MTEVLCLCWEFDSETIGDGNCLYRAIEQQLRRPKLNQFLNSEHRQLDHVQLRKQICDFMMRSLPPENQPQNSPSIVMGQYFKRCEEIDISSDRSYWGFGTIREFLSDQKRDKVWANQIMIQGAACFLGIGIGVASTNNTSKDPVTYFRPGIIMDEETAETLCLGNYRNIHFQSFIPRENEE